VSVAARPGKATGGIVGLPFGIAGLFVLWRWQHPALRPQVSGAPA